MWQMQFVIQCRMTERIQIPQLIITHNAIGHIGLSLAFASRFSISFITAGISRMRRIPKKANTISIKFSPYSDISKEQLQE